MERIYAYQTADGKVFGNPIEANQHDTVIKITGLIQQGNRVDALSPRAVAESLVKNSEQLGKILSSFKSKNSRFISDMKRREMPKSEIKTEKVTVVPTKQPVTTKKK